MRDPIPDKRDTDPPGDPCINIYKGMRRQADGDTGGYERDYFRASEVSRCHRQVLYSMLGHAQAPARLYSMCVRSQGNQHHHAARNLLRHNKIEVYNEEDTYRATVNSETSGPFDIKCRVDGRLRIRRGGRLTEDTPTLLEVKSFSIFYRQRFEKAFRQEAEIDEAGYAWPKGGRWSRDLIWEDYYAQTQASMWITGLNLAYYLPLFRDSGKIGFDGRGLFIERDETYISKLLQRLGLIFEFYRRNDLMDPEHLPTSRECSYCDFWHLCHGAHGLVADRKEEDFEAMIRDEVDKNEGGV